MHADSHRKPWNAPRLTTLDVALTQAGPSPNIQETALTDDSLAPSPQGP